MNKKLRFLYMDEEDFNINILGELHVGTPEFQTETHVGCIQFDNQLDLTPTLHMSGEIIIMDGNVVIDGDNTTINGNLKINGTLILNGTLQTERSIINTNNSSEIAFFGLVIKNGVAYIHDKLVTNPSEVGLYILQKSNEIENDHIKSIEDI